ncbi:MAG: TIGR03905 family TSCPD domain-containing protein [Fusobacterium sp. JB021]|nr:TIGR03905 family TSCPD domain-containing protein [Fusobacterium sp. JB020]MDP0493537.1 TIGR03905 family TSCPD domain-containing protein [Fusobacterium sp. JB021]MDP0506131.1 TIGR03905 family TSCPD domain-containing protein [Fusobacterium sp. JB019]
MKFYQTTGTCAKEIGVIVKDNIIEEVKFVGGCDGNTKGLSSLLKGMKVEEVITRLKDITCRTKPTSCPDQLAKILEENYR